MSGTDIYSRKPAIELGLTRVGLRKINIPIKIVEDDLERDLTCEIDVFTDLPRHRRGGNFSRQLKGVESILWTDRTDLKIEQISSFIGKTLTGSIEYAETIEVDLKADMFTADTKNQVLFRDTLYEQTLISRENGEHTRVGVEVQGITACPCTMEKMRGQLLQSNPEFKDVLPRIPMITHNQRNLTSASIEVRDDTSVIVNPLLEIIRELIGSIPELGPGSNDIELVYKSHTHPLFVEDVVREVAAKIGKRFSDYDRDAEVTVTSRSEESIRSHDAFAEFRGRLSEIG